MRRCVIARMKGRRGMKLGVSPRRAARLGAALTLLASLAPPGIRDAGAELQASRNGFAISPASVAVDEILSGGPPRDGIPALDGPKVQGVEDAPWSDDERMIGVSWEGGARAYPLSELRRHGSSRARSGGRVLVCVVCFSSQNTGLCRTLVLGGPIQQFSA